MKKNKITDEKFSEDGQAITSELKKENTKIEDLNIVIPDSSPYEIRDIYYSQILNQYIGEYQKRRKQIKWMRNWLFWLMLTILFGVIISCISIFFIIIANFNATTSEITALITVCVSFISTIITIPVIIAKSLFPEKEDNQIVDVLTKLIENDNNIRNTKNNIKNSEN